MEERYLIDTNILIDAQIKKLPESGVNFLSHVVNRDFNISFITYIEYMGYNLSTKAMKDFIKLANVFNIEGNVIDICIDIRKAVKIKLPDAIIAATSIAYNLSLITRNVRDFRNVPKLNIINHWEI